MCTQTHVWCQKVLRPVTALTVHVPLWAETRETNKQTNKQVTETKSPQCRGRLAPDRRAGSVLRGRGATP